MSTEKTKGDLTEECLVKIQALNIKNIESFADLKITINQIIKEYSEKLINGNTAKQE